MDTPRPVRRAAVAFIFITILIDILSFGIIIPVLPHLVEELAGGGIANAARWVGLFGTLFALTQFIAAPIQGALSDRFGRRPVILASSLGLGVDFMIMALAPTLWLLLVGRLVSGVFAASFSTANAYIADITPPERRAASYGLLGAAFGIGFIVGPALGGVLGHYGVRWPFWAAGILAVINFCYGLFILPESLPKAQRSARIAWREANPLGTLLLLRRYPQVTGLATAWFLLAHSQYALNATYVLYTDYRFGWGPQAVGWTLALVGLFSGLVQAGLVRRLVPRLGERRVMLSGLAFSVLGYIGFGLAGLPWLFLAAVPVLCLGGLAGPPAQALMTAQVGAREQGRLQGALSSLQSFSGIFGPALFAWLFAFSITPAAPLHLPGSAFLLAALLVAAGAFVAARATRPSGG